MIVEWFIADQNEIEKVIPDVIKNPINSVLHNRWIDNIMNPILDRATKLSSDPLTIEHYRPLIREIYDNAKNAQYHEEHTINLSKSLYIEDAGHWVTGNMIHEELVLHKERIITLTYYLFSYKNDNQTLFHLFIEKKPHYNGDNVNVYIWDETTNTYIMCTYGQNTVAFQTSNEGEGERIVKVTHA